MKMITLITWIVLAASLVINIVAIFIAWWNSRPTCDVDRGVREIDRREKQAKAKKYSERFSGVIIPGCTLEPNESWDTYSKLLILLHWLKAAEGVITFEAPSEAMIRSICPEHTKIIDGKEVPWCVDAFFGWELILDPAFPVESMAQMVVDEALDQYEWEWERE